MKFLIIQFSPLSHHLIPILLSTLFSNPLSLCSSLHVRHQVSHPYRTTGIITVLHILMFMFFDSRREDRSSGPNCSKHYQNSISSYFPSESNFDLLLSSPNIWSVTHFQRICLIFLCPNFDLHSGDQTATCSIN
jgi:hypothetical protein